VHFWSDEIVQVTKHAGPIAVQVRGFSNAQFKGFRSWGEAQACLQGGTALHSLHPSSRPQTKRRQTGGPAWQGALLQQYGLPQQAQLPHQHRTLAAASSSEELPGASGNEGSSYPDRMLCHPAHMYRLVSTAHHISAHSISRMCTTVGTLKMFRT
jgi:hypothetical protein